MKPIMTFVLPFYEETQDLTRQIHVLSKQTKACEIIIFDERLRQTPNETLERAKSMENVKIFQRAHRNRAALFNDGVEQAEAGLVSILPADIFPRPDFSERISSESQKENFSVAYTDFEVDEPGKPLREEKLWPFHNVIEERFSLGYFRVYEKKCVLENGGFDEDLDYAEEYDFRLRVQDRYAVKHIAQPLYLCEIQEAAEADVATSRFFSPGAGSKGGFSYLFYTPEMERETETVFKNYLKRIGCFLTHKNQTVAYTPNEEFEVMVSIVIPILNRRRFIGHTVQIVLDGTFNDFEILIVDNGSTDGTQDEVRSIADPRVRLVQHDGTCIAEALNRGISEARGKYIAQLDSDDEYMPDTLETMTAYMETHPKCGLAISYYDLIDIDSQPIEELGVIKHLEFDRNNILRVDGGGALRFFHKKVLEEFGLYNVDDYGNFGEDYDMVLKISEKYDVDRVHKVLYRYRRHDDNTDVQRPPEMKVFNKNNARQDALKRRRAINNDR